jgi:alkylation response protein AidB-like acyl-CoA dehydrogenase
VSSHQAVAHLLADGQVKLEACRLMVYQAAWQLEQEGKNSSGASMCKLFVSEHFKSLCLDLCQIYASEGFHADSEIGRSVHEAMASTVYSGTSQIQRNIIAGWMGL